MLVTSGSSNDSNQTIILGASFKTREGGQIVSVVNKNNIINTTMSAAAVFSNESVAGATRMIVLVVGDSGIFVGADNTSNAFISFTSYFCRFKSR